MNFAEGSSARLAELAALEGVAVRQQVPLSTCGTFQLGGPAAAVIDVETPAALGQIRRALTPDEFSRSLLIGKGSNLLFSDQGWPGWIIRYTAAFVPPAQVGEHLWEVPAAVDLDDLAAWACAAGLEGWTSFSGIPGTLAGAISGNAGAWGVQIADRITEVGGWDAEGKPAHWEAADCGFAYRDSRFRGEKAWIATLRFRTWPGDVEALRSERNRILAVRAEKHPDWRTTPCIGSYFRNLEPTSAASRRQAAGWFLDQIGARGRRLGGAAIFEKHANIPIKASKDCTASDVHHLMMQLQQEVKQSFGFTLQREIRHVGKFDSI